MQQRSHFDFQPLATLQRQPTSAQAVTAGMLACIAAAVLLILQPIGKYSLLAAVVLVLITVAIIVYSVTRKRRIGRTNEAALQDFAAQNNMRYQLSIEDVSGFSGTLFEGGNHKRTKHVLSGEMRGLPFRTYEYYYRDGGRKNREHEVMVVEVTLPRVVPHFVIDSHLESVIPLVFKRSQRIELEGDFHKFFDLYAPDTYGVSALTILAPDTMEVLMQHAVLCDIEVVQNKLYFYWSTAATSQGQYQQIFETVDAVLAKIGRKLASANIYATDSQAQLHASPVASGERLKRANIAIVSIGFIILYILTDMIEHLPVILQVLVSVGWVGFVGYIIWIGLRQRRLKKEYMNRYKKEYK